ncbi:MAG: hypothetical protein ACKOA8_18495 [Deltaproteobacteria bacterium]
MDGKNPEYVSTGITLDGKAGTLKVSGTGSICVHKDCKNRKGETIKLSPPQGLVFAINGKQISPNNTEGSIGLVTVHVADSVYTDNSGSYDLKLEWCPK